MRAGWLAGLAASGAFAVLIVAAMANPAAFAGPSNAARPSASIGTPQVWAESASSGSNSSEQGLHASERASLFFADSLTVTATNTSTSTVLVETVATETGAFGLFACAPTCGQATGTLAVNETLSTDHVLFENLTNAASVEENGSSVSALGVLNAAESMSETTTLSLSARASDGNVTHLDASAVMTDLGSVSFASALGLAPWHLPSTFGLSWNDTSAYTANVTTTETTTESGNLSAGLGPAGAALGMPANASGGFGLPFEPTGFLGVPYGMPGPSIACLVSSAPYGYPPGSPGYNGSGGAPGTNSSPLWVSEGGNCSYQGSGNETAFGSAYLFGNGTGFPFSAGGSTPPFGPGGPSPALPVPSPAISVGLTEPYVPGVGVTGALPGSAFFGGAMRNWTALSAFGDGGYGDFAPGLPAIPGTPIGTGGPYNGPPGGLPIGIGGPTGASRGAGDPSSAPMSPLALEIVGLVAALGAVLLVAGWWSLRGPRPPTRPA